MLLSTTKVTLIISTGVWGSTFGDEVIFIVDTGCILNSVLGLALFRFWLLLGGVSKLLVFLVVPSYSCFATLPIFFGGFPWYCF